jgi:hypothetical protein
MRTAKQNVLTQSLKPLMSAFDGSRENSRGDAHEVARLKATDRGVEDERDDALRLN